MNYPKEIKRYCPKCKKHTTQKVSIYKAGKRRASAIGERRHAEDKKGYGGQKFPKCAHLIQVTIINLGQTSETMRGEALKIDKHAKRCSHGKA